MLVKRASTKHQILYVTRYYARKILSANHGHMVAEILCFGGGRFVNRPYQRTEILSLTFRWHHAAIIPYSNIKFVRFRAINDRPYRQTELFNFMFWWYQTAIIPYFSIKTTIVEKSGLVAPDFFREYHSVCRRNFQKTDVRTRSNSVCKLSLPQNERREYHVGTPCEGSLINCQESFWNP